MYLPHSLSSCTISSSTTLASTLGLAASLAWNKTSDLVLWVYSDLAPAPSLFLPPLYIIHIVHGFACWMTQSVCIV